MTRKPKALRIAITPQDAPDKPGYYFLHSPWSSFSAPVEVRAWADGWQVYVLGSLYPLRSSQDYSGATWYFLGGMMETIREAQP